MYNAYVIVCTLSTHAKCVGILIGEKNPKKWIFIVHTMTNRIKYTFNRIKYIIFSIFCKRMSQILW